MNEQALRALVRQAVAHHLEGRSEGGALPATPRVASSTGAHLSHALFVLPAEPGGPCIIEPAVTCNHCGFCKSYGH